MYKAGSRIARITLTGAQMARAPVAARHHWLVSFVAEMEGGPRCEGRLEAFLPGGPDDFAGAFILGLDSAPTWLRQDILKGTAREYLARQVRSAVNEAKATGTPLRAIPPAPPARFEVDGDEWRPLGTLAPDACGVDFTRAA